MKIMIIKKLILFITLILFYGCYSNTKSVTPTYKYGNDLFTKTPDRKIVILSNLNADQNERLMEERHFAIINGQKIHPLYDNSSPNKNNFGFEVVSKKKWLDLLPKTQEEINEDWLTELSVKLAEKSQESLKESDISRRNELKLMSYIVANYIFQDKDPDAKLLKLKTSLYEEGLNDKILSESNEVFLSVLNETYSKDKKDKTNRKTITQEVKDKDENPVRKATPKEKALLVQTVKDSLRDPYSAVFGDVFIINNKSACVSVNAKNGFGGYTGNNEVLVHKNGDTWLYMGDDFAGIKMPCRVAADLLK